MIGSYIHAGAQIGVLVEVNCESDFVARTDDFQELVHDVAMQIAAADPQFVRKEDVTKAAMDKERDIQRSPRPDRGQSPKRWSTKSSKVACRSTTKRFASTSSRS